MNKKEINKLVKTPPTQEEIAHSALLKASEEDNDYIDLLLQKAPKKARAVQLVLSGSKTAEIASLLGVTTGTILKWLKEPETMQYMQMYQKDEMMLVQASLKAATTAAVEKMVDLLNSPIDGVALQAAKDLLDRTGHKPKQEVKKEVTVKTFEQQLTDLIGEEALDVDYEEVE